MLRVGKRTKNRLTLGVEGELSIYAAEQLKGELLENITDCPLLVLDLSAVSEMDTAGLQLLYALKRECAVRASQLRIDKPSPAVLEVLELCNAREYFTDPA